VTIAVFNNPDKDPLFSFDERITLITKVFKDNSKVTVHFFSGLLAQYAEQQSVFTIIRGLRAVSDFDYEFQLSLINRKLNQKLDTIFLMTDEKYSYLSSSVVRQLSLFNASVDLFVPEEVSQSLKEKRRSLRYIQDKKRV
jgi:pantetheine-phosphate adenylyltransferase